MKTTYESIIIVVLMGLALFLLFFSVVQAQAQISYITVHTLNPHGIETVGIERMDPHDFSSTSSVQQYNKNHVLTAFDERIEAKVNNVTMTNGGEGSGTLDSLGGDWSYVLLLLNNKRSKVGKDSVSVPHPEDIDLEGVAIIKQGTEDIFEDYGFAGLADALNCAGYAQSSWSDGFDCKGEIWDILSLMILQSFFYAVNWNCPHYMYGPRKMWSPAIYDGFCSWDRFSISCGDFAYPAQTKFSKRRVGYFRTEKIPQSVQIGRAWLEVPISKCGGESPADDIAVCHSDYYAYSTPPYGHAEAWEGVGEAIGIIPAPTHPFMDWEIGSIELDPQIVNRDSVTPIALRLVNDLVGGESRCTLTGFSYLFTAYHTYNSEKIPTASFTYAPENPAVGEEITFDASSSHDPDGEIVSYNWDFGDENAAEGEVVTHAYGEVGEYTVILTVTDNDGLTNSAELIIEIIEVELVPPVALFTYAPEDPVAGEDITFDASSSHDPDGEIVSYNWDFGDENAAEGEVVTHAYGEVGEYTVILTVTDNDGLTNSAELIIEIKPVPTQFMISFDDGPLPGKTPNILAQLSSFLVNGEPVKAGFFMLGHSEFLYYAPYDYEWVKGSVKDHPDLALAAASAGHVVANHTQHHAWFPQFLQFGFSSMTDFVTDEISQANSEIQSALGITPPKVFRPPYLQGIDPDDFAHDAVYQGAEALDFEVIGGLIADCVHGAGGVRGAKLTAKKQLEEWEGPGPAVLIFHDNRWTTHDHIGEILSYLVDEEGFVLVDFDPALVEGGQRNQAMTGIAHSPVELRVIDPEGLVLSKQVNEIPGALYEEFDEDGDGGADDFFLIPEPKVGNYLIEVVPETDAYLEDTYSLTVQDGYRSILLANEVPLDRIPEFPYVIRFASEGLEIVPAEVRIEPETINLRSEGKWLSCYIELPADYDVNQIDISTVALIVDQTIGGELSPTEVGDSDDDGIADLKVKFNRQAVQDAITVGDVQMIVSGSLTDGHHFLGVDVVSVIDPAIPKSDGSMTSSLEGVARFGLEPNYPDPFNTNAVIRYSLPEAGRARLDMFNILGQRVRVLVNAERDVGQHQVVWDGRDDSGNPVCSGVYIYRLTSGTHAASRKMVLLK